MKSYITRQQVREINRKLFANEFLYSSDDASNTFDSLLYDIMVKYNPEDKIAEVPTILEVRQESLNEDLIKKIDLINRDSIIFQINSSLLSQSNKIDIIKTLKEKRFKLIIEINKEDKVFTLVRIFADYIKFDIQNIPDSLKKESFNCKKIAYNVNSPEDFMLTEASHIDLYEGTYISPSTQMEISDIKHSKANFIEIIALTNQDDVEIKNIVEIIQRDSLMSAQMIRLANSAYFRGSRKIESVNDAIIRIGLNNMKRYVFLLQFSSSNSDSEELLKESYHKAIFCEEIIKNSKIKGITSNEAYLIGLFSMLDMLTGKSMDSEISSMNLTEVVEDALIYRDGIGGQLLNLIKAYGEGKWNRVDKYINQFKLNKDKMYKLYFNSLDEVTKLWDELAKLGGVA